MKKAIETISVLGLLYLVIVLVLCSCGGSDPAGDDGTCDKSQRAGSYLLTYEELQAGGQCGAIPPVVVTSEADQASSGGCVLNSGVWSTDDCRYTSSVTCTSADGLTVVQMVGYTDQDNTDASNMSGMVTVTITDVMLGSCTETYSVTYVRQ